MRARSGWRRHAGALLALILAISTLLHPASGRAATGVPMVPIPSAGKDTSTPKPPEDPAKIPDFVGRLDDRQARAVLLDTLSSKTTEQSDTARESLGDIAGEAGTLFRLAGSRLNTLAGAAASLPDALSETARMLDLKSAPWPPMAAAGLLILLAGLCAEGLVIVGMGRVSFSQSGNKSRRRRPKWFAVRALGLGGFTAATAIVADKVTHGLPAGQQSLLASFGAALLLVRLADLLAVACIRLLIPPSLAAVQGRGQRMLRLAVAGVHAIPAFGAVMLGMLARVSASDDLRLLVSLALWTLLCVALAATLRQLDRAAAPPPPEQDETHGPPFGWLRAHWLGVALSGTLLLWLFTTERALEAGLGAVRSGVLTLLVAAYAPAVIRLVTMSVRRAAPRLDQEGHVRSSAWVPAFVRCTRILGALATAWFIARIWNADLIDFASNRFGESTVRAATSVISVLLLAYVAWEIVKAFVRGSTQGGVREEHPEDLAHMQPASRMQTFLPLVEKFLFVIVVVVAGLGVLRALGVDTGPLLAGAGIIGIAIGFGAQTLVRDIVSGIFFLFDDAFRLGEYVEIDQTRGTVEGISIRSLRIRHHRGAVHTVPFGTIQRLTNYSRDWIILKLEFLLAFETDLSKVKKIVKQIGKELIEDPEFGQHFLEPVKSQGVRRMEQIGMVVGVKFMAKPGEQFILRREVYQRVRDAFEKNGIAFARPQVVVQVPPGSRLSPDEEDAIKAAAADVGMPEEPPPGRRSGGAKH